jgi:hypothetical protein
MTTRILSLALALLAAPEPTVTVSGGLDATVETQARSQSPVWIAWTVPMLPGTRYSCCFTRDWKPGTCRLEEKNQSWGSSDGRGFPEPDGNLVVLARLVKGEVVRVRSVSGNCPVDAGRVSVVHLTGVDPGQSVAWLHEVAKGDRTKDAELGEDAAAALALHRNASADSALADLASARYGSELRGQALFWLGEARGRPGFEVVARVIASETDEEVVEAAVHALSESPIPEAGSLLLRVARTHRSTEIRGQALYALADMGHPAALATILEAVEKDPDQEVREQAVFALSELPKGAGIPHLVKIGREHRDREIRRQAILCLTESDDPRAAAFLDQILSD